MGRRIVKKVVEVEEEVWSCAITGEDIEPGQEHTLILDNKKVYYLSGPS